MKILHLIDSEGVYGAERLVLMLAREHIRVGHEVTVGTIVAPQDTADPLGDAARRDGIAVKQFHMKDGFNVSGMRGVLDFVKRAGIDVLHSHGYKANIYAGMAPRRNRPPAVATLHGWTDASGGWSRVRVYAMIEKLLLRRLDAVVAVSQTMVEDPLLSRFLQRLSVIPNGIDLSERHAPLEPGDDLLAFVQDRPSIACVGRLSKEKGVDVLLDAMPAVLARHPGVRLVLFGDGPEAAGLREQADSLGISDSVFFAGYCGNVGAYLPFFDALVIPSRTEGLPLVLLEAMAAGTPVAASPVGAIPWVLDGGNCGVLLDRVGDPVAVATGVNRLLSDSAQSTRLRAAARQRIESEFSSKKCSAAYESIYQNIQSR